MKVLYSSPLLLTTFDISPLNRGGGGGVRVKPAATFRFTPPVRAHIWDGALAALCGDVAQQVDAGHDAGDDGHRAVRAARVGPLLRAHEREVVAVEPVRQLLQGRVQPYL